MTETHEVQQLPISSLKHYKNHTFKLYTGKRLEDLAESIKANGVLQPIIVRPLKKGKYEILSGHNRVEASKLAGNDTIPAIVREGLTDDEASFIVTETNLLQRSFADLSHSERANALAAHYDAVKHQGKRTDLLSQLQSFINDSDETSRQPGEKYNATDETGKQYGLSARNVSRYVRLSKLIKPLQERMDNGEFSYLAGIELAFIDPQKQSWVHTALEYSDLAVDIERAKVIRKRLEDEESTPETVIAILDGSEMPLPEKSEAIRIGSKLLKKYDYFRTYRTPEEVEDIIDKALEAYFSKGKRSK
jgi:ParB family chromosome partitioning protein